MLPLVLGSRQVANSRILSQVEVGKSARAGLPDRGSDRLLHDCTAIGRMLAADQPSAVERLEGEVGVRLAALLRSALTGDQALQHCWQATVGAVSSASTGGLAVVSDLDFVSFRPEVGRILVLHPEYSTAVSLGMGRNMKQRMVSPVGASQARARKAAFNEGLQPAGSTAEPSADQIELACECDDEACPVRIVLSPDEYAFLRTVPGYYAVSPDHISPDDHIIVGDPGRFAIVE
jgi:hypothetical protein